MVAGRSRSLRSLARAHWLALSLLIVGAALRVAAMVAYQPALFFGDSWGYVVSAFSGHTLGLASVALSNDRPSGYPVLLWLLSEPGRDLTRLIAVQHVAGLAIGALVYVALLRAGIPRFGAACAAALVLLDGYTITLEQYVMSDTFFALTVLVACLLLAWPALRSPPASAGRAAGPAIGPIRASAAGLLLAAGTLERLEGAFAIPVLLAYLLWRRAGWRALLAYVLAAVLPLLAYAGAEQARFGTFALTQESGWTLYGRIAGFADCAGAGVAPAARPLCETAAQRASQPDSGTWYIFDGASPAVREFGPLSRTEAEQRYSDGVLRAFSIRIIEHQPLAYLDAAGSDFLRFFTPGATAFDDAVSATSLPAAAAAEYVDSYVQGRFLPGVQPSVRAPAAVLRVYRAVVHVPRPVLALLALAALLAVALRTPWCREVLLLAGSAVALLAGTAATAGFGLRYLLCAVPLLAIGGTLALRDVWATARGARRRPAPPVTEAAP
ncbi:MAG: phospholipid carrier-dependent glycosyltransferase [Solirubrobacteraceae bacterium]